MPLYMDVHHLDGPVTADDVAKAHMADLQVQDKYDVNYQRYWVDEANSTIFCLVEAPVARRREHRAPRGARAGRGLGPRGEGGVVMRRRAALAGALVALAGLLVPFTAPATAGVAGQVAAARAATHHFTHPRAAKKSRLRACSRTPRGIACIAMKGMGAHGRALRQRLAGGDGKIRLRHPEALVYRFTFNGHLRLAALEYLVLRKDWRAHHPTGRPRLFGHRFNLTPAGNRFGLPRTSRSTPGCGTTTRPAGSRCGTRGCTAPSGI